MFWNRKPKLEPKPKTYSNRLTITFTDKNYQWWESAHKGGGSVEHWRDFYKWFFSREQSNSFTLLAKGSRTTILRKNIYSFRIDILED